MIILDFGKLLKWFLSLIKVLFFIGLFGIGCFIAFAVERYFGVKGVCIAIVIAYVLYGFCRYINENY